MLVDAARQDRPRQPGPAEVRRAKGARGDRQVRRSIRIARRRSVRRRVERDDRPAGDRLARGVAGLEAVSLMPVGGSAEAFEAALRRDYARWADVVKATGVKGE